MKGPTVESVLQDLCFWRDGCWPWAESVLGAGVHGGSQVIPGQGTASLASVSVPNFGSWMIVFATNVVQGSAIVLEHGRTDGGEAGGFLERFSFN